MPASLPTQIQISLLDAIVAGQVSAAPRTEGGFRYYRTGSASRYDAPIGSLWRRGWVGFTEDGAPNLTERGKRVLSDAHDLRDWNALDSHTRPRVKVTQRHRGKVAPGRNVVCRVEECTSLGDHGVVWFTNETGAPAQREALVAEARHGMRHVRELADGR